MLRFALVALCAAVLTTCPALASDPSARSAASVPAAFKSAKVVPQSRYVVL
jgi:hypothetical protein